MQRLSLEDVRPSMVLATTIKDRNGNIILLKGVELTERQIAILKSRDIKSVIIEGSPLKKKSEDADELLKEVDRRFSAAGANPMLLQIRDIIKGLIV